MTLIDIEEYEEEDYESDLKKELLAKSELKPCPFCSGDAELRDETDGRDETYAIHCNRCHMHFEKFVWRGCGRDTVIKEWNRRVKE